MINQVYQQIGSKLENVKESIISADEMEELFRKVEEGQLKLEAQLAELKSKNLDLLKTLNIPSPFAQSGFIPRGSPVK